jgi:hypothetical protein
MQQRTRLQVAEARGELREEVARRRLVERARRGARVDVPGGGGVASSEVVEQHGVAALAWR